jgi:hypothetical protein
MARPPRIASRRLPDSVRRRLEVATAMAWESLVETHVAQANEFVDVMEGRFELEDALARYLAEMDLDDTMAAAVRTRVFVTLEHLNGDADSEDPDVRIRLHQRGAAAASGEAPAAVADTETLATEAGDPATEDETDDEGWRRFRPDVVVRGVIRRQRQSDADDARAELALARAEEAIILTHVENAISFTALLEDYVGVSRGVQYYLGAVVLSGSRAHSVFQRAMARLADVHLPQP